MILVTGGAGFIGSNLVAALEARGLGDIVVCDRFGRDEKWKNLAKRELAGTLTPETLFPFLEANAGKVEAIFHMGGISATTERDVDLILASNFALSQRLWDYCTANQSRLFYASSAATYGDGTAGFDDDDSPAALARLRPMNAYGWSKHMFDRRVSRLSASNAPRPRQWAGLKFFNVYGPNEYHKGAMRSVVAHIYPRALAGEPARLFRSHNPAYPDGGQRRDFVYVEDCVDIMLWLYDNPGVNGIFNSGSGKARTFAELAGVVYGALGKKPMIEYIDTPIEIRDRFQYFTEAKMGRLRAAGYTKPATELERGVKDYVQTYLSAADPYR
jgi:ADP-L-glycero-D-manno-heptose 6-epimerase